MPWLNRNGTAYYYRSVRKAGRVVSVYVGAGEVGEMAEAIDRSRRAWRALDAEGVAIDRDRIDLVEADVLRLYRQVEALARTALEAAGYHLYKRGEWRRTRMVKSREIATTTDADLVSRTDTVVRAAQGGDTSALPDLRRLLALAARRDDGGAGLLRLLGGDVAAAVERSLVHDAAGPNLAMAEAIGVKMQALRRELDGENPSPLERILVDRCVLCWLDSHCADLAALKALRSNSPAANLRDRARDRAHRRYLSSLRSLASVRKLAVGTLVLAVAGQQQVNVR